MSKLALNAPGPSQREAARKNIQTYGLEFSKLPRFVELRPVLYQSFARSVPGSECAIIIISQPASQPANLDNTYLITTIFVNRPPSGDLFYARWGPLTLTFRARDEKGKTRIQNRP